MRAGRSLASAVVVVAVLISSFVARGQTPSQVMELRSISKAAALNYRLFTPTGYSSSVRYPLLVAFHGIGEDGATNTAAVDNNGLVAPWISTAFQQKHPCFVVAPHNPEGTWTGLDYWIANTTGTYSQGPISDKLSTVMSIIDSLCSEFSIDTNRIYLTGLSIGGWAVWDLATRFPRTFAAAVPLSGAVDTTKASLVVDVPIWCAHGQADAVVTALSDGYMMAAIDRLDGARGVVYTDCRGSVCTAMPASALDSLISRGAIHVFSERKDWGHDIWNYYYGSTVVKEWVFRQSKEETAPVRHEPLHPIIAADQSRRQGKDSGRLFSISGQALRRAATGDWLRPRVPPGRTAVTD